MPTGVHAHTPTLSAVDPRGLAVRAVAYHRAVAREAAQARVTQVRWDAAGRAVAQRDARLFAASPAADGPMNVRRIPSLSGAVLAELSTDAGPRVVLFAAAGQPARAWAGVDGPQRRTAYDDQRRPTAVYERNAAAEAERCVERLAYAGADAEAAAHNRCGRLIRHDDPAGTLSWTDYGLTGMPLAQTRRFLATLESPDWPDALPARDALLEPAGYLTAWTYDALGAGLTHTDAAGHRRTTTYTVAGQVRAVWLALASGPVQPVLTDMDYTAAGQLATQTAGNGVITVNRYDPANDRLHQATVRRGQALLQDQRYAYDPVGNITAIADAAAPVRYHRNRRIAAVNTYAYDSLGQLVEASGSESAQAHAGQPGLPVWQPLPGTPLLPYRQRYVYDAGGNLTQLQHTGQRAYTLSYTVAATSNRALPWQAGDPPPDWDTGFDAHGNLQRLSPGGAALAWNARHQLRQVTPLARADEEDDTEVYVYDGGGQRVRKVGTVQAGGRTQHREVRYLPGLELRTDRTQAWMVIEAAGVRVLQWTQGRPADIPNDQARYALSDHLGSRTQELDHTGALLSAETYYPFGGTAAWAGRNEIEVRYKTQRYSGKERDASGLYYYGFRYYAPWVQRWLNADPAGDVDGLNRYGFVRNSPVSMRDATGLNSVAKQRWNKAFEYARHRANIGNTNTPFPGDMKVTNLGLLSIKKSNPEAAKTISTAIMRVHTILDNAATALASNDADFFELHGKDILVDFTGTETKPKTIFGMDKIGYLRDASYQFNPRRIVGFEEPGTTRAFILEGDITDTVYLNLSHDSAWTSEQLAFTLIHELSHLHLGTQDYWYLEKDLRKEGDPNYATRMGAARIRAGALLPSDTDGVPVPSGYADKDAFIADFRQSEDIRPKFMEGNADNIAGLAYALHYHYGQWSPAPPVAFDVPRRSGGLLSKLSAQWRRMWK
jgi:insecticidal toxin complex protein TccC